MRNNLLKDEYCYFDGKHGRVRNYATLTASLYYPVLQKQVSLASMECKHDDSINVELFWRVFNDAYKLCNGHGDKFMPRGCGTDMAGANFSGLSKIYGDDIMERIKGCEFHFKKSVEKYRKIIRQDGDRFKSLANEMLVALSIS